MTLRRTEPAKPKVVIDTRGRVHLDWNSDNWRFRDQPRHCRLCGMQTFLMDDDRRPVHKFCLEDEMTIAHRNGPTEQRAA